MKSQDILILLKLLVNSKRDWRYAKLAQELGLSPAETHKALRRCAASQLYNPIEKRPVRQAVLEFLRHGLSYVFPATLGDTVRGMPTAYAASPLSETLVVGEDDKAVWPDPSGDVIGRAVAPLFASVPMAARRDNKLYRMLTLVDTLRIGRAREKVLAWELLVHELA